MTRFISVRTSTSGGPVATAATYFASEGGKSPSYEPLKSEQVRAAVAGRQVILAIHGFNVPQRKALPSYIALEQHLELSPSQVFFGVLWPGDFWLPVINYPAEAGDAVRSGRVLANALNTDFLAASSLSLISHSLGGRVLLELVAKLKTRVAQVCVTAGAVDDNCLAGQYAAAKANSDRISVLASKSDRVLQLAYPAGDFASDLFWRDNDSPWRAALGRKGPNPVEAGPRVRHEQIPTDLDYGHGNYFPPDELGGDTKWMRAVEFMRASVNKLDAPF